ncbi:uncharacterized protein LOC143183209 [Calliopsis andreniformis]|uniref:uncharacterized protein LOC143183209 n=1 Tax=Calliopsis andreniformis TaxID=337506 RepID=UPI003FCE2927
MIFVGIKSFLLVCSIAAGVNRSQKVSPISLVGVESPDSMLHSLYITYFRIDDRTDVQKIWFYYYRIMFWTFLYTYKHIIENNRIIKLRETFGVRIYIYLLRIFFYVLLHLFLPSKTLNVYICSCINNDTLKYKVYKYVQISNNNR